MHSLQQRETRVRAPIWARVRCCAQLCSSTPAKVDQSVTAPLDNKRDESYIYFYRLFVLFVLSPARLGISPGSKQRVKRSPQANGISFVVKAPSKKYFLAGP
jgi:hypothetical protein